jgi:hypothetical protein
MGKRIRTFGAMAIVLAGSLLAGPAVGAEVYVRVAPPSPPVEVKVVSPGAGYVWVGGYHRWSGTAYAWVPGRWSRPPRVGVVWVPGHWKSTPHGWVWKGGHWR